MDTLYTGNTDVKELVVDQNGTNEKKDYITYFSSFLLSGT